MAEVKDMLVKIVVTSSGQVVAIPGLIGPEYVPFEVSISTMLAAYKEGHTLYVETSNGDLLLVDDDLCLKIMEMTSLTDEELKKLIEDAKIRNAYYQSLTSLQDVVSLLIKLIGIPVDGLDNIEKLSKAIKAILANREYSSFTEVFNDITSKVKMLKDAQEAGDLALEEYINDYIELNDKALADLSTAINESLDALKLENDAEHQLIKDRIEEIYIEFSDKFDAVEAKFTEILNSETLKSFKDVEDAIDAVHKQNTDTILDEGGEFEVSAKTIVEHNAATDKTLGEHTTSIADLEENKVDKEDGKELYPTTDKDKVAKLITDGDGKKVLYNNGEYKKIREPYVEEVIFQFPYIKDDFFVFEKAMCRTIVDTITFDTRESIVMAIANGDVDVLQAENEIKEYILGVTYNNNILIKYKGNLYITHAKFTSTEFDFDLTNDNIAIVGAASRAKIKEYIVGYGYQLDEMLTINKILYRANKTFTATTIEADITSENIVVVSDGLTHVLLKDWILGLELKKDELCISDGILYRALIDHIAVNLTDDRTADKIELVSDGITRIVLNPWKTATEYMKHEIFESGAILYRAKVTHTSSTLDADILAGKVEIVSDGLLRAKVEDWKTDILYTKDDIILYNKVMYRCLLTHTSGVFTTDNTNLRWQTVSSDAKRCTIEDWLTDTAYDKNNIILYNKELYRVKSAHTSGAFASDLANGLLELFSEGLKQAAIAPWLAGTKFGKYDVFTMNNFIYRATSAHTAGTFDTDLTNGLVELLGIKTTTLNTYAPSTKYATNEIFVYNSVIYRVKVAHTSSTTDTTPDTDFNLNRTEKIGFNTKFFIPAWSTNTSYGINEVFGVGKLIYRAKVAHTSGATYDLDLNSGKIEVLGSARDPWIRQWVAGTAYAVDDLVYSSAKIYRAKTAHSASASITTDVSTGKMEMLSYEGLAILTWTASTAYKKYNILLDNTNIINRYEVIDDYTSDAISIDNDVTNGKLIKYQIHEKDKDTYLDKGGVNQVSAYELKVLIDTVKFLTVGNVTLLIDDNNVGISKTYSSAKIEELISNCAKYSDVYTKEYMSSVFALKEDLDFDASIVENITTDDKDNLYYKDVLIKNELRQRIVEYTFSEVYVEYGKCIDLPNILLNFGLINPVKITATFYNKDTKAITFGVKKADSLTFLQEVDIAKDKCETYELPSYTDLEIYAEGIFRVDIAITGYNLADFVDLTVYNNHERNMDDGIGYGTPYAISARWIYEAMEFLKGVNQDSLHNKDLDEWLAKNKAYAISAQTLYNHIANHPPSKTPPSQVKVSITTTPQIVSITGVNTSGKVLVQPYEYNTDGKLNIQTVVENFDNLTNISGDLSYVKSTNGVLQPVNSETVVANTTIFGSGKLAIFDRAGLSADINILGQSILSSKTVSKPQTVLSTPITGTLRYDPSSLLLFDKTGDVVSIDDTNAYSDTLVHIPTLTSYLKGNFTGDIFKLIVKRHTGGAAKVIKIDGVEYSFNDYYSSDTYMTCVFSITGLSPFIEHTFELYGDNTYLDAIDISIGCELKAYAENSTNRYGGILLYKDAKFYSYDDTTKTATELVGITTPTESDFNGSDYKLTDFTSNEYMVYVYTSSYNISSFTIARSFIKPVISLYRTIPIDKTTIESLASLAIVASASNNSKIKVGFIDSFSRVVSVIGGTTVNVLDVTSKSNILNNACDLAGIATMFTSTRLSEIYTAGSITIVLFIVQDSVSDVITLTEIDLYVNKYGTQKLLKESYYDVDITVGTGAMEVTIHNKVGKVITVNYY